MSKPKLKAVPRAGLTLEQTLKIREAKKKRQKREARWKSTHAEVASAAREIRELFSTYSERMAAARFDIVSYEMPISRVDEPDATPAELAERLNLFMKGLFEHCYKYVPDKYADDFFTYRGDFAETVFAIGVFAGAIFHGAEAKEVERLERGLVKAMMARAWEHKKEAKTTRAG